jgi:ArsR family transcriptional regulator, lead/cadmium/zinc/bismuth-responsive transcriptional repressor
MSPASRNKPCTDESSSAKTPLARRPLLTGDAARDVADLFKILSSDTRVALLHALVRSGELCVSELAQASEMTPQAVSNQLQRLVERGMLGQRREGHFIYYRIVDSCVAALLDRALCLLEDSRARVLEIGPRSHVRNR